MLYSVGVEKLKGFREKQRRLLVGLNDFRMVFFSFFATPWRVCDDIVELQTVQSRGSMKEEIHLIDLRINR